MRIYYLGYKNQHTNDDKNVTVYKMHNNNYNHVQMKMVKCELFL